MRAIARLTMCLKVKVNPQEAVSLIKPYKPLFPNAESRKCEVHSCTQTAKVGFRQLCETL